MESKESEKALERYKLIVDLLTEINDKRGLSLVKELAEKCITYINLITSMELNIKILRFREASREEYQASITNMDKNKRLAHNALISQLTIVNRYLFKHENLKGKIPVGGIFSLDSNRITDRRVVGDWAFYLVEGFSNEGIT